MTTTNFKEAPLTARCRCPSVSAPRDPTARKGEFIPKSSPVVTQRLLARREEWLNLVEELGWAVALYDADCGERFNDAARAEWQKTSDLEGEPKIAAFREHLWRTASGHIRINRSDLLVWDPVQEDCSSEGGLQMRRAALRHDPLSTREAEILSWLREGKSSDEIAIILGRSQRTIEKHQQNLYRKLGVANALQAILHPG